MEKGLSARTLLSMTLLFFWGSFSVGSLTPYAYAQEAESEPYFYNPAGKRDPFLSPFHTAQKQAVVRESKAPFQRRGHQVNRTETDRGRRVRDRLLPQTPGTAARAATRDCELNPQWWWDKRKEINNQCSK